jgi:hypothetical protein
MCIIYNEHENVVLLVCPIASLNLPTSQRLSSLLCHCLQKDKSMDTPLDYHETSVPLHMDKVVPIKPCRGSHKSVDPTNPQASRFYGNYLDQKSSSSSPPSIFNHSLSKFQPFQLSQQKCGI